MRPRSFLLVFLFVSTLIISLGTNTAGALETPSSEPPPDGQATLGGSVRLADGSPVVDVVIDFFAASKDGRRIRFLGDDRTDKDGSFRRVVTPGCYVLVFIAPDNNEFIGGGVYDQRPVCVAGGEVVDIDASLASPASACIIQGQLVGTPLSGSVCDILVTLYTTTDGPNWSDNRGWNSPTDPCTWFGVACSGSRLEEINLTANGLSGEIPPELGLLSDLVRLDLELNQSLTGPIPPELGQLAELRALILSFTPGLTGPIPPELGQLTNLRFLTLEISGALTGPIPPELGQLSELENLYIRRGRLTGPIPPELGQLTKLKQLLLDSNELSGPIPRELGDLDLMEDLLLNSNMLSGQIPPELGGLANLETLSLGNNQLSGSLPAELGQIPRLRTVEVDRNLLSGDITAAMSGIRDFGTVQRLDLSDGPGGNNCLTVTEVALADWIAMLDPDWDECK